MRSGEPKGSWRPLFQFLWTPKCQNLIFWWQPRLCSSYHRNYIKTKKHHNSFIPKFNFLCVSILHNYIWHLLSHRRLRTMCFSLLASQFVILSVPDFDSSPPVYFLRFQLCSVIFYWFLRSGNLQGRNPSSRIPRTAKRVFPTNLPLILLSRLLCSSRLFCSCIFPVCSPKKRGKIMETVSWSLQDE